MYLLRMSTALLDKNACLDKSLWESGLKAFLIAMATPVSASDKSVPELLVVRVCLCWFPNMGTWGGSSLSVHVYTSKHHFSP